MSLFAVLTAAIIAPVSAIPTTIYGSSLQNELNARTEATATNPTGSFYDVTSSQYNPDQAWVQSSTGLSSVQMMFELAGFAGTNTFGIYDINNTANRLELFNGAATTGSFAIMGRSGSTVTNILTSDSINLGSSPKFGFYLDSSAANGGGLFFSDPTQNTDQRDHLVSFQGSDTNSLKVTPNGNPSSAGPFTSNDFVLAWEDLALNSNSTPDFNDMVVMVESYVPVPEPGSIALMGLGLVGLGMMRRKKKA